jgi:hypothetical protein
MTVEAMQTVAQKAVSDADFRNALLSDPDQTLAAYVLTPAEGVPGLPPPATGTVVGGGLGWGRLRLAPKQDSP